MLIISGNLNEVDQTTSQLVSIVISYVVMVIRNAPMLLSVNQIEIHPFLAWDECVSMCQEEGIAVMAYSPLAQALKMRDPTLTGIATK